MHRHFSTASYFTRVFDFPCFLTFFLKTFFFFRVHEQVQEGTDMKITRKKTEKEKLMEQSTAAEVEGGRGNANDVKVLGTLVRQVLSV